MKLIKIGAVWCPACIIMNQRINKIAKEYNLDIISYDYDIDSEIVKKYNIGNILPALIVCDDNLVEKDRLIGEKKEKDIKSFIEVNL